MFIGEAISQSTGNPFQGLASCRARIEVRIIRLDSGKIIYADGRHASGIDRSEAIAGKKAIQKASIELGNLCVEQLQSHNTLMNTTTIDLVISGLKYEEFLIFEERALRSLDCIENIAERSYVNERTILKIDTNCDTESLSKSLLTKDLAGYGIEVSGLSATQLVIAVKKK